MTFAGATLLAWAFAYASVVAWALVRARLAPREPQEPLDAHRVLLVRPCAGSDAGLASTLRSSAVDDEPTLAIRFAVGREDDAATPIARAVTSELRAAGFDAEVVVTGARAANRKADQLARAIAAGPLRERIVVADSDVELARGDLAAVLAPLRDTRVGAAWSVPVPGAAPVTHGDRLDAAVLGATFHAFTLLAAIDPGGLVGKLMAIQSDELAAVGGFGSLVTYLGEDVELARRLRARGDRVHVAGVARAWPRARGASDTLARLSRWLLVVRGQRPALLLTYPLLFFPALPAAMVALFVGGDMGTAASVLFLVSRVAIALWALPAGLRRGSRLAAVVAGLVADGAIALAFVRALATTRTTWRGTALRVERGGMLREEAS